MSNKTEANPMKDHGKREWKPTLRFAEFRDKDGWEEYTGDRLFEQINDRDPDSNLPVLAITQEYGAIPRDAIDYHVSVTDKSIESYKVVQVGDFIISLRSFQGGIEYSQYHGICSPAYVILRRRIEGNNSYFKHYLKTDRFIKLLTKNLEGLRDGKMVSYAQFSELSIPVPSPTEQQEIAECLTSLDELIAAHVQKLDALKAHKKGLMQQLFPREGQALPSLRFPEFHNGGSWAEKTLGEIADILMCKRIFSEETNDRGGVPFYKIGTLGGKPDAFISGELFKEYKSKYNYPRKGEVLITCSGTVGKCIPFDGNDAYYQDSNIVWIDNPTLEVSNELMLRILINVDWGKLNSTTISRIYGPDLRNLLIRFPVERMEQQKIADSLTSLDDLITFQAQELEALKTHKKGLMQQLFPSTEEVEA
jgi:type I restriction enzyme S subunit